jgi:AhpD family alkylhydroperoxidase
MNRAFAQLTVSVWDPEGSVHRAFKRLIAHVASRAAGCQYCMAHTASALQFGVEDAKGECGQAPVAAAIANGIARAIGVRLRDMPLTPERIKKAMGI